MSRQALITDPDHPEYMECEHCGIACKPYVGRNSGKWLCLYHAAQDRYGEGDFEGSEARKRRARARREEVQR
jgi:hypothetical protein